jgi:hypothetical protein
LNAKRIFKPRKENNIKCQNQYMVRMQEKIDMEKRKFDEGIEMLNQQDVELRQLSLKIVSMKEMGKWLKKEKLRPHFLKRGVTSCWSKGKSRRVI